MKKLIIIAACCISTSVMANQISFSASPLFGTNDDMASYVEASPWLSNDGHWLMDVGYLNITPYFSSDNVGEGIFSGSAYLYGVSLHTSQDAGDMDFVYGAGAYYRQESMVCSNVVIEQYCHNTAGNDISAYFKLGLEYNATKNVSFGATGIFFATQKEIYQQDSPYYIGAVVKYSF